MDIFKLPVNSLDLIAWLVFWLYVGRMALWMSSKLIFTVCSLVLPPCYAFQSSQEEASAKKGENDTESDGSGGVMSLRYMCKMCVVRCNGEAAWKSHVIGKKHQAKNHHMIRMARGFYWCGYCDADCRSRVSMESHLNGKKHLANIQEVIS